MPSRARLPAATCFRLGALAVAAAWVADLGQAARGEAPGPDEPLALTISGGGTKGAYMAGHLYYIGQLGAEAPGQLVGPPAETPVGPTGGPVRPRLRPVVFTGASAGAINALLAAFTTCTGGTPDPTASLYWQAWTGIGLREAFRPSDTTATGLMTTKAFDPIIARMRALWDAGFPATCDLLVGVAITRAHARPVVPAPNFPALPRSRETVLLRITGQGAGRPPLLRNVVDRSSIAAEMLLPLDGPDADPFGALTQLVLASAAFPIAFKPVSLAHCLSTPGAPSRCTPADARPGIFMDGGIFDNQPLGLALQAMRFVTRDDAGGWHVADTPALDPSLAARASYYFLDPRARAYPSGAHDDAEVAPRDTADVLRLLAGMVESSAANTLISVFEQRAELRERLLVARTYFPQIAGTFNGFLERAFREFDFYLGMYNAARTVREHPLGAGVPDLGALRVTDPDPAVRAAWQPFACLRAVLDDAGDPRGCDDPALTDFRILLQVVLDQLADDCRAVAALSKTPPMTDHRQCKEAMAGAPAPHVPGVRALADRERWRQEGESQLAYQLRLLGAYRFHFVDLGLARADAEEAPRSLIRLAHRMGQQLADAQPELGWSLGILGRIAVDFGLGYVPPEHSLHAVLGLGAELGYSGAIDDPHWDWLRFSVALGFDGLSTVFNASDDYLALIPKAGLEFELLGRASVQLRLGLRAGYQFSTGDGFLTGTCHADAESRMPCSRFMTEAYVSASFLGLLRLQLAVAYEPGLRNGEDDLIAVRPMLGFQFNSPF